MTDTPSPDASGAAVDHDPLRGERRLCEKIDHEAATIWAHEPIPGNGEAWQDGWVENAACAYLDLQRQLAEVKREGWVRGYVAGRMESERRNWMSSDMHNAMQRGFEATARQLVKETDR